VMVGRASYGAPWAAGLIASGNAADIPSTAEQLADYVAGHYEDMLALYGVESGLRQARKHLGWYLERHAAATSPDLRKAVMTSLDPAAVIRGLREAFAVSKIAARDAA